MYEYLCSLPERTRIAITFVNGLEVTGELVNVGSLDGLVTVRSEISKQPIKAAAQHVVTVRVL